MAQFPKYKRQVSARGMQAPFQQKQVNTDYAKSLQGMGTELQRTGQTLADIDNRVTQIKRDRMRSDAVLQNQMEINKGIVKHSEDRDPKNRQFHQDSLRSATDNVLSNIEDPAVRNELSSKLKLNTEQAIHSMMVTDIKRDFEKELENYEIMKQSSIFASNTLNPTIINRAKVDFDEEAYRIAAKHDKPVGWAENEILEADKERLQGFIYTQAKANFEDAKITIEDADIFSTEEKDGLYSKAKQISEREIKAAEEKLKKQQTVNEDDLLKQYLTDNESVSEDTVVKQMNAGVIRSKFAKSTIKMINSTKKWDAYTLGETYTEMINKWQDISDKGDKITLEEISDFRAYIMDLRAEGKLTRSDMSSVLSDTNDVFTSKLEGTVDKLYGKANPRSPWNTIKGWALKNNQTDKDESSMRIHKDFIDRLRKGEDAELAVNGAINTEFNKMIAEGAYYPNEIVVIKPGTQDVMFSYDSGATWVNKRKTKK